MDIQLEFFGYISDQMGKSISFELTSHDRTIGKLRMDLAKEFDNDDLLKRSVRAVINDEVVSDTAQISNGDIVSFMSPFSGG